MKGKKLLALLLAAALGVTQVGTPIYAATDLDDMPDLEFEEGVEDWNDCFLYGHTEVIDPAVAATCTKAGKTQGSHCKECGEVLTAQKEIPSHGGHQIVLVAGKEPTTTEAGWTESSYCSRCKEVFVPKVEIPALSAPDAPDNPGTSTEIQHKLVKDAAIAATLQADGKTEGLHCSLCKKVFVKQETIARVATVKLSYTKATYTGKNIAAPVLTVKDRKGIALKAGTDYTASGLQARKAAGVYQVKIVFKGRYQGSKTLTYAVVPKAAKNVKAELYGYDDVKVTWSKASGATGYTIYYKISGSKKYKYLTRTTKLYTKKNNLTDGKQYIFKVVPYYKTGGKYYTAKSSNISSVYTLKKVTGLKVTKSGTKAKVVWKDIKGETGYQISKATKKSKTSLINKGKLTKGKYKKVTAAKGKTYYYKVRACKKVKIGKKTTTIYGPWSNVKSFKRK